MSDYTIVNLKEVEDQAPKFGMSPNLESRFGRVALESEQIGATYLRIAPNFRIPFGHTHKTQEEVYIVVSGSLRMKLGDKIEELKTWDAIRMSKETARGVEGGPEGAEIIAIGVPGGPGDAEMIDDFWTD